MKKVLIVIFMCLAMFESLQAQSSHLEFKNIPIDGTLDEFVQKLKNEGYTLKEVDKNVATMKGTFLNKPCELYVFSSQITKTVWKVVLYLPKNENWYSLKSSYKDCVEQYTIKYGSPEESFDFFVKPYYEGDGYEIQALENEKCHYFSYWEIKKGILSVNLSKFCQLSISYEDAINLKKYQSEKEAAIQDEI